MIISHGVPYHFNVEFLHVQLLCYTSDVVLQLQVAWIAYNTYCMTRVSPPAHINRFIIPRDLSVTPVPFFNLSWIISMTLRLWISGYKSGNLLTESLYSSWTLRQFEIKSGRWDFRFSSSCITHRSMLYKISSSDRTWSVSIDRRGMSSSTGSCRNSP